MIRNDVIKFLLSHLEVKEENQIDEQLAIMDSLDQTDLGWRLEGLFDVKFPSEFQIKSYEDIISFLERQKNNLPAT